MKGKINSLSGCAGGRIALRNQRDLYPYPMVISVEEEEKEEEEVSL